MLASENDALRGGKVGGVGDVIRDLPRALAALGRRVTVMVPSYGFLHTGNASTLRGTVSFPYGGKEETAQIRSCLPQAKTALPTSILPKVTGWMWARSCPI